jgi:hypothetical protein
MGHYLRWKKFDLGYRCVPNPISFFFQSPISHELTKGQVWCPFLDEAKYFLPFTIIFIVLNMFSPFLILLPHTMFMLQFKVCGVKAEIPTFLFKSFWSPSLSIFLVAPCATPLPFSWQIGGNYIAWASSTY